MTGEHQTRDVEPVFDLIKRLGKQTSYGIVEINLIEASPEVYGLVAVSKVQLDLFAAELYHASPELYQSFLTSFPDADAGRFIGYAPKDDQRD